MSTASRPVAPRPVAVLPVLLFEPRRPALYVVTAVAVSLAGALLLSSAASALLPAMKGPAFPSFGGLFLFMVVIFAPFLETAIMAGVIEGLHRFLSPWATVAASAAGWGLAHSSMAPVWGLVIWWPFTVFSLAYLVWRQRGWWQAYLIAATIHALQNAVPAASMAFA